MTEFSDFEKGKLQGYAEAMDDIKKELLILHNSLNSISIPLICGLLDKMEKNKY